jgi:hypothetical protein
MLLLCCAAAPATSPAATSETDPHKLVQMLGDGDALRRTEAASRLIAMGHTARPALLQAYENDDPQIRLTAAQLILKLPFDQPDDPPGVAGFLKQYGRPTAGARVTYLRSVISAAGPAAPRILLRLVREEPSDEVRWAIVALLVRLVNPTTIAPPHEPGGYNAHSPNVALAAWLWEGHDKATAMRLYRRWLDLEDTAPTIDRGAAIFAFKALGNAALSAGDFDTVARALRVQLHRNPLADSADRFARATRFDELFALHATVGPLAGHVVTGVDGVARSVTPGYAQDVRQDLPRTV